MRKDLEIGTIAQDVVFSSGMQADSGLKDPTNPTTWDPLFINRPFHGVVLVAGDSHSNVTQTLNNISTGLMKNGAAFQAATTVVGDVRPGKMRGFEQYV